MHTHDWDVIIAGGGPAGLSAALMLGRARRRVLVIDAGSPRSRFAAHMHGVLGNEGTEPRALLARGRAEAAEYGVEFTAGTIERVAPAAGGLTVVTNDGVERGARALIAATGLSDELPPIPGLAERWGRSVLHCPYCHGWEVRDQRLGVLATSLLGLHAVELVRQWSEHVTLLASGLGPVPQEAQQRLRARGVEIVTEAVVEILGDGDAIDVVRLEDGRRVALDAVFTEAAPCPHDGFLALLELSRTDTPFGSFLAVDGTGRTSEERVWAVGNVVDPRANVPISIGAGALTGGTVNAALVGWDFDETEARAHRSTEAPADFWEHRYGSSERIWSGRVNEVLADVAVGLRPGCALDLGCGEGADVIWLAQHGWDATGMDISCTAIDRATAAAQAEGLEPERARFIAGDLTEVPEGSYDLVTASFFHSPVELPRGDILRQAAARVASGGHLLITAHADSPPTANVSDGHDQRFLSPDEELAQLDLDPELWSVLVVEKRARQADMPDGRRTALEDVVVLARRV